MTNQPLGVEVYVTKTQQLLQIQVNTTANSNTIVIYTPGFSMISKIIYNKCMNTLTVFQDPLFHTQSLQPHTGTIFATNLIAYPCIHRYWHRLIAWHLKRLWAWMGIGPQHEPLVIPASLSETTTTSSLLPPNLVQYLGSMLWDTFVHNVSPSPASASYW